MKDYKNLSIKVAVMPEQIKVDTVVLNTGMTPEEFREFMGHLSDACRIANNKYYAEYEEAKAEFDNAATKEELHDAEWRKRRAYEKWDVYSALWNWAMDLSDYGKEDEGEGKEGGNEE